MSQRIALVTGGTGGIGTHICQTLSKDNFIVVAGYSKGGQHDVAKAWQQEQQKMGYDIHVHYGDVSQFESAGTMIAEIQEKLGPIDVLINNAGIAQDSTLKKMTPEQWQKIIDTNLHSVFNVTRHVINSMLERQYGRIVNISSINGQKGQFGQTNYSAAKAGMHGFTKSLALETARKGITVNTVSPGYVHTQMMQDVPKDILEKIIAQIPVGRLAHPKEIARLISFLAHEDSEFITGADYSINGGQHMS